LVEFSLFDFNAFLLCPVFSSLSIFIYFFFQIEQQNGTSQLLSSIPIDSFTNAGINVFPYGIFFLIIIIVLTEKLGLRR
jgi:hypothetical protein